MENTASRKTKQQKPADAWPKLVQPGRAIVRVYRRQTPSENWAYMVANYADGEKRRFDSYSDEREAMDAAEMLAKRLDKRDYVAASMTKTQASEYANGDARLKPFNVSVDVATSVIAECLGIVHDINSIREAVRDFANRRKQTTKKPVSQVVAEFLEVKENRSASERYIWDLKGRLERFAGDCNKDCCNINTADIQGWLDGLKLSAQSYRNYRTVLHTLFQFAVARGYAAYNPVEGAEKIKVRGGDIEIFKPEEIDRLLSAAKENYPDYVPCLAIGAFAGLRSAEIERLSFSDIDLESRHITVSAGNSKTASRRIVPIHDNLASWLAPYADREGKVWTDSSVLFYKRQESITRATEVKADEAKGVKAQKPVAWKSNALRHSYASYRFAQTGDAGRVAGELGNSANVVHRHYRQLVKPDDAEKWFAVKPVEPSNVVQLLANKA